MNDALHPQRYLSHSIPSRRVINSSCLSCTSFPTGLITSYWASREKEYFGCRPWKLSLSSPLVLQQHRFGARIPRPKCSSGLWSVPGQGTYIRETRGFKADRVWREVAVKSGQRTAPELEGRWKQWWLRLGAFKEFQEVIRHQDGPSGWKEGRRAQGERHTG